MTPAEMAAAILDLRRAYPRASFDAETAGLWHRLGGRVEFDVWRAVVDEWMAAEPWPPSFAELAARCRAARWRPPGAEFLAHGPDDALLTLRDGDSGPEGPADWSMLNLYDGRVEWRRRAWVPTPYRREVER
jgi:hypothetical protein